MNNKVEICGVNTSELKVIPNDENIRLLGLIKQGNKAARDKVISGNLKLVLSLCLLYTSRCV